MEMVEESHSTQSTWLVIQPWVVCVVASLFFFYEFIQGNMFASIADNIMHDFNIQVDKMAYMSSIYYLSNVVFLFVAGMMLDRYSTKKTMMIAMLLCVLSTFVLAHTQSFYLALLCRFVTGIGSAFCFLGPIRIASRWFPPTQMAMVTGIIVTIAMTGGMLAQYPLTKMVVYFGWRESVSLVAWFGLLLFVLMVFWIKDKPAGFVPPKRLEMNFLSTAKFAYMNTQNIRAALYTSLMNMAVAVFGAMLGSLYLIQRLGVSKEEAAMVNSMLFLGAIFGGPVMGWMSDRMGLRVLPMKIGAVASLLTIVCIMYFPVSLGLMGVLFFLLGFFTASQVISYAFVAESSPPAMTATAVSLISILTQGGYIVYQNIFSKMLTWSGDMQMVNNIPVYSIDAYQHAAILFPIGIGLALFLIMHLRETHCKRTVV
jgi:MFS family permease